MFILGNIQSMRVEIHSKWIRTLILSLAQELRTTFGKMPNKLVVTSGQVVTTVFFFSPFWDYNVNMCNTYLATYLPAYTLTYIYIYTYLPTYLPIYVQMYLLTYLHIYLHTYQQTYKHYKHTYIHIYLHT